MAIDFPPPLLVENSVEWNLAGAQISPGQTASGMLQSVRIDGGGLWIASLNDLYLGDETRLQCLRALRSQTKAGTIPINVPRHDVLQPWPLDGDGNPIIVVDQIPHYDGSFFSDGSGYSQSVITAESVGSADLRAVSLTINIIQGSAPTGGEAFSINHPNQGWRMYEIGTVMPSAGNYIVTFLPPLREAVADGTDIEFDQPRCVMLPIGPTALDHKVEVPFVSKQSMKFVEYFAP